MAHTQTDRKLFAENKVFPNDHSIGSKATIGMDNIYIFLIKHILEQELSDSTKKSLEEMQRIVKEKARRLSVIREVDEESPKTGESSFRSKIDTDNHNSSGCVTYSTAHEKLTVETMARALELKN